MAPGGKPDDFQNDLSLLVAPLALVEPENRMIRAHPECSELRAHCVFDTERHIPAITKPQEYVKQCLL
jgi:hypothetical protein